MARAAVTPSSLLGGGRAGRGRSGRLIGSAGWAGPTAPAHQPRDLLPPHTPSPLPRPARSRVTWASTSRRSRAWDASSRWKGLVVVPGDPSARPGLFKRMSTFCPSPDTAPLHSFLLSLFKIFFKKMCFACILFVCSVPAGARRGRWIFW